MSYQEFKARLKEIEDKAAESDRWCVMSPARARTTERKVSVTLVPVPWNQHQFGGEV